MTNDRAKFTLPRMTPRFAALLLLPFLLLPSCVRRTLTITSEPPGALVYLNDQEVGRTPVTRDFTFYGNYDVQVRLDGYQTIRTNAPVIAPWWQWVPIDFFAEALPLTDKRKLHYSLSPISDLQEDPAFLMGRADELRLTLPATNPAVTNPATASPPAADPTTQPSP